jgi:hypothetical protein
MLFTSQKKLKKKICFLFKKNLSLRSLLNDYFNALNVKKTKYTFPLITKYVSEDVLEPLEFEPNWESFDALKLINTPVINKLAHLSTVKYKKFYLKYLKQLHKMKKDRYLELYSDKVLFNCNLRAFFLQRRYYKVIKQRKIIFCFLTKTRTNIFLTAITNKGKVLFKASGGSFKAKKRRLVLSTVTSVKLAEFFLKKIKRYRLNFIYFFLNIYLRSYLLKPFFFTLKRNKKLCVKQVIGIQRFSHNGCRFRKLQRK